VLYGQRISEDLRFTKEMIRYEKNKEGVLKPFIEFTQVKTDKISTQHYIRKLLKYSIKETVIFQR
jgi:hypothetical protein